MRIEGQFTGKALKITIDTLLDQFRRTFGGHKTAGDFNFLVEFSLSSQNDAGGPEQAEAQLNALLGAARALSDNTNFGVTLAIQAIPTAMETMTRETQRLVENQMAAIESLKAPALAVPPPSKIITGVK